jgi:hypothetical protein
MRKVVDLDISGECIGRSIKRAGAQESIYGHNTGHFTLQVEKQNTTIGVIGEEIVREFLETHFVARGIDRSVSLTDFGSEFDLEISASKTDGSGTRTLHVKSGLWKNWPNPIFPFGIHADQRIQNSKSPLVLVSFLKGDGPWPIRARIEGYLGSQDLLTLPIIRKGERFPVTGVESRTDNLLSYIHEYRPIENLLNWLEPNSSRP